jgi:hypothetical protein
MKKRAIHSVSIKHPLPIVGMGATKTIMVDRYKKATSDLKTLKIYWQMDDDGFEGVVFETATLKEILPMTNVLKICWQGDERKPVPPKVIVAPKKEANVIKTIVQPKEISFDETPVKPKKKRGRKPKISVE